MGMKLQDCGDTVEKRIIEIEKRLDKIEQRPVLSEPVVPVEREIKLPVDTPIKVWDPNELKLIRHFNCFDENKKVIFCFPNGFTSSTVDKSNFVPCDWAHAETIECPMQYWGGGECPVSDWMKVEVVFRDGKTYIGIAEDLYWEHYERKTDLIGWRLVAGQKIL